MFADAESRIIAIVERNRDLVLRRGEGALKPMMGETVTDLRGKVDGEAISELLRRYILEILKSKCGSQQ